jgi:hypothetical protein
VLEKAGCPLQRWPYLREGDPMRIEGGALDGLVGRFVRANKSSRVVVSVTLLQRSVSVELSPSQVTPIRNDGEQELCAQRQDYAIQASSQSSGKSQMAKPASSLSLGVAANYYAGAQRRGDK